MTTTENSSQVHLKPTHPNDDVSIATAHLSLSPDNDGDPSNIREILAKKFGDSSEAEDLERQSQKSIEEKTKAEQLQKDIEDAMDRSIKKYNEAYTATMREIMMGPQKNEENKK